MLKGGVINGLGILVKIVLALLLDKYLAFELGPGEFGNYKFGVTAALIISSIATLGFASSIPRELAITNVSGHREKIITNTFGLIVAISSLIITSLYLISLFTEGMDGGFVVASFFYGLNTVFIGVYSGVEDVKRKVLINDVLGYVVYLACAYVYFSTTMSYGIWLIYFLYNLIVFLLNGYFSRKLFTRLDLSFYKSSVFKEYLRYTMPLYLVALLIILSLHLDKIILKWFVSDEDLGNYFAAFNISNLLPLILTVLVFIYLPKASVYFKKGKKSLVALLNSYASKWTLILASAFFLVLALNTEEIIRLLYTEEFDGAGTIVKILALGQWFNVAVGFTGQNLIALGDSKMQLYVRLVSFATGTLLLYLGVYYYEALGAAVAMTLTILISNSLQIFFLYWKHGFFGYKIQNAYCFAITVITGTVLGVLHQTGLFQGLHFFLSILIDLMSYALILLLFRSVSKDDLRILKIIE